MRGADPNAPHDAAAIEKARAWQRRLYDASYVALAWPRQYGGQEFDPVRQSIVNEEMVRARAPGLVGAMGVSMLGPTLISWGSDEQKRRYLPKILTADEIWCQGYSEPGCGLRPRRAAHARGDSSATSSSINGQKVWTSGAHYADWMFCLVRTDPEAPKHRGISYVLVDMRSPGITVRPLIQMTGDAQFQRGVLRQRARAARKPGRQAQRGMAGRQRDALPRAQHARARPPPASSSMARLVALARSVHRNGRPLTDDPVFRQRLADLEIRVEAMKYHMLRQLTDQVRGRNPGIEAMVNKLVGTELNHDIATAAMEAMGDYAMLARGEEEAIGSRVLALRMDVLAGPGDRRRHLAYPEKHHRRARAQDAQVALVRRGRLGRKLPQEPGGNFTRELPMDFGLSDEQRHLRESAREFLTNECSPAYVRKTMADEAGAARELYAAIAGLGWNGLIVPERYGGAGMGMLDMAVLLAEAGYAAMPGPFLFSSALAASALVHGGSDEIKERWLPALAAGTAIGTVAVTSATTGSIRPRWRRARGARALDGCSTAPRCSCRTRTPPALSWWWRAPDRRPPTSVCSWWKRTRPACAFGCFGGSTSRAACARSISTGWP